MALGRDQFGFVALVAGSFCIFPLLQTVAKRREGGVKRLIEEQIKNMETMRHFKQINLYNRMRWFKTFFRFRQRLFPIK